MVERERDIEKVDRSRLRKEEICITVQYCLTNLNKIGKSVDKYNINIAKR